MLVHAVHVVLVIRDVRANVALWVHMVLADVVYCGVGLLAEMVLGYDAVGLDNSVCLLQMLGSYGGDLLVEMKVGDIFGLDKMALMVMASMVMASMVMALIRAMAKVLTHHQIF